MTHVITQNCCNDAACVPVCPVNCIHPSPDEPGYGTAEMLYIDPQSCIDCGACIDVCPVAAIFPDYELPENLLRYEEVNARYYADPEKADYDPNPQQAQRTLWQAPFDEALRVAIVGSGPAACYAAEELLSQRGLDVRVDMFERLPTPWGLVRFGVAPDHQHTKAASAAFARTMRRKNFRLFLNVEVGSDVMLEQLQERYHAVVYAVGAMGDRSLGVDGEDLSGSHSATEFVAWYNGHPDYAGRTFDLSHERAVILGNGNVALDVARVLVARTDALAGTDIAEHALEQLAQSKVREVVVVGRRGPAQAAFTTPELLGLKDLAGVDLLVHADEVVVDDVSGSAAALPEYSMPAYKAELLAEVADASPQHDRRITLRFLASPSRILGTDRVEGVELVRNELVDEGGMVVARATDDTEVVETGLVLRSVGYRGQPIDGLPFDERRGVLPNVDGRIVDPASAEPLPGLYTAGWIKRGPSGVIGTNKKCARETVAKLLTDWAAGVLPEPAQHEDDVAALVPDHLDANGWKAIDAHERAAGADAKRPRVKLVDREEMLRVGRAAQQ
ncbi:FAD-dependent oxidoreductase [Aeromicrobium ginsengisoli]|uniref:ferredoxin--NADP(+) reductase n=1 Tax=Aeromicrobium ginsengisoli TaxID=363867 RepID=A0A5M4F8Z3_9ACTN|nr:FAD-dependent oxidoreductase [Aeromicrobium ginsengisoli]KAA1394255.1 4Fe-4S dicluster domain-containing protein [Aeromicrobium ginsengisoli]